MENTLKNYAVKSVNILVVFYTLGCIMTGIATIIAINSGESILIGIAVMMGMSFIGSLVLQVGGTILRVMEESPKALAPASSTESRRPITGSSLGTGAGPND